MRNTNLSNTGHLVEDVEQSLKDRIKGGEYSVGDKLPTVNSLVDYYGVSRTVVREAISGLRAAGLIVSRRGSGVFVRSTQVDFAPDALFAGDWPKRVPDLADALELRAAVEIQSVTLAATRASNGQMEDIHEAHNAFVEQASLQKDASAEDFAFHAAIARATNNRYFEDFLSEMGKRTIPRENLSLVPGTESFRAFMSQLVSEHELIMGALEARDPEAAAEAMRVHLIGSLSRYRKASHAP